MELTSPTCKPAAPDPAWPVNGSPEAWVGSEPCLLCVVVVSPAVDRVDKALEATWVLMLILAIGSVPAKFVVGELAGLTSALVTAVVGCVVVSAMPLLPDALLHWT